MSRLDPSSLAAGVLLAGLSPLFAQSPPNTDPPTRHVPVKPVTGQELDHLEAVKLYGLGVIQEHGNRLVEAMHTFEAARRLDPESAAIHRTLIPLYLGLDRIDDALATCRRVLELDPGDYDTGYRYARQLRVLGKTKEALAVLTRTADCPGLKDRLEVRAQLFYDLGVLHEESGDWAKAEKSLREVVAILDNPAALMEQGPYNRDEINAQAAETFERLGRICLKNKKTAEAIEAFQKALKKDPLRTARLSYHLAEVYVEKGDWPGALAQLDQYLRTQPQGMDGYELRITVQKKLGRQADIVPALEKSAGADHNNVSLQLLLAREYRRAGLAPKAEPIYTRLLERSPTPDMYRGLFELYREDKPGGANRLLALLNDTLGKASGESDDGKDKPPDPGAAAHARAMLIALRDDTESVKGLLLAAHQRLVQRSGLKHATRLLLANLAARTNQLKEAEELYRSCLNQLRGPRRRDNEHEVYHGLLMVLARAHKHQEIIDLCNEGLKRARTTSRVLFCLELAQSHMALGHVRESLAAADEAVNAAGTRETTLRCRLLRAELHSQAEKHEPAIAECQALLKEYNQPGDIHAIRSTLSAICSAAHQYDKAEEQLLIILKEDPDDATANNDLGYLWADRNKNLDEAEKRIRKALELDRRQRDSNKSTRVGMDGDRDHAAYVDSLGWVLFRKGDWTGARRELERASSLPNGDDDPVVWDHLGDVCFRLKETVKAGQAWRKAIELYESAARRRPDARYREIKEKLRLLRP